MPREAQFKYFLYIAIAFVAVLMVSDTVAVKIIQIGPFVFSGAIFLFHGRNIRQMSGKRQAKTRQNRLKA